MSSGLRHARRIAFGLAVAGVMLLLNAGPAAAATGTGTYADGYEIPSMTTISQGLPQCATFHASNNDPTTHTLPMTTGTFGTTTHDDGGTATFTITNAWYAGPQGTFSGPTCGTPASVSGVLAVSYEDWDCSAGTGSYSRTSGTVYSLSGTVVCDDLTTLGVETTSITVTFSGDQILCGGTGQPTCNHVDAGTNLDGDYSWSTP